MHKYISIIFNMCENFKMTVFVKQKKYTLSCLNTNKLNNLEI